MVHRRGAFSLDTVARAERERERGKESLSLSLSLSLAGWALSLRGENEHSRGLAIAAPCFLGEQPAVEPVSAPQQHEAFDFEFR